jgi:hypothetical protein
MYTLHIEHPITDFDAWQAAFARFAPLRLAAGVRAHTVRRPVDDPRYVSVDLEFDTAARAEAFLQTLRSRVWANPADSPALAGDPITRILVTEDADQPA